MKKSILMLTLLGLSTISFSCRENKEEPKETVIIKEVQTETVRETEPEREGILERAAQKVDNKVNNEVDKQIEKIDDK